MHFCISQESIDWNKSDDDDKEGANANFDDFFDPIGGTT